MSSESGLWGTAYAQINDNSTLRKRIARALNVPGMHKDRELIVTLLGVVDGSTALVERSRVAHSLTDLGGKRIIETVKPVNRATTTADETDLTANILSHASKPTTYPVNLAHNR